jgi:hypothetical protein
LCCGISVTQYIGLATGVGEDGEVVDKQRNHYVAWLRRHKTVTGRRRERSGFDREEYHPKDAPLDVARHINKLDLPRRPVRTVVGLPEQAAGRLLARYLTVVRTHRFDQAAKADEQWRILLDHLRSKDGNCYINSADSDLYGRVLDQVDTGWAFDLQGWLESHSLLEQYDRLAGMVQRGRRGWADDDLWGLESRLAKALSGSLRQIVELSFCWPDRVWDTHEEWVVELRRLADRCEELAALEEDGDETAELVDEVFAGLRSAWGCLHVG